MQSLAVELVAGRVLHQERYELLQRRVGKRLGRGVNDVDDVVMGRPGRRHLARNGQPSRAEVTDAAMGERAECVMLNKGPHIAEAISTLDSILTRMQDHHDKKRSLLRRLRAWDHTDQPR
jgi:hypothetical protein